MATVELKAPKLMPGGWNVLTTFCFGVLLAMSMSFGSALYAKYLASIVLKLLPG